MLHVLESYDRIVETIPKSRRDRVARDEKVMREFLATMQEFQATIMGGSSRTLDVRIPGRAWEEIASAGLSRLVSVVEQRKHGRGYTVSVTMLPETARTIAEFCRRASRTSTQKGELSQSASLKTVARRLELELRR